MFLARAPLQSCRQTLLELGLSPPGTARTVPEAFMKPALVTRRNSLFFRIGLCPPVAMKSPMMLMSGLSAFEAPEPDAPPMATVAS